MEEGTLSMPRPIAARSQWRRSVGEAMDQALPAALSTAKSLLWSMASAGIALTFWQLVCLTVAPDFPAPLESLRVCVELLRSAFTVESGVPGIVLQVTASLKRIAIGFTLSAAIAIPAGVLIGVSPVCRKLFDPIVQVLRPVSPLVWFPLALVAFKDMGGVSSSTLFTIFITSLWPTLINTAVGVSSLPADYKIVAKVFRFSRARYLRKILLPHTLPYILTGLRLSMGNAWLVIVAAEMLSGDLGIGFFAWDSYNAGSYERMIAAVAAIGAVGLTLDRGFNALYKRFDYRGGER